MMFDIVDEIFDEHASTLRLEELEWNKTKETSLKDGLREGIAAGKEKTLQTGFDMGYEAGYQQVFQLAALRGVLSAVGSYTHLQETEDKRIKELIKKVAELEKKAAAQLPPHDKPLGILRGSKSEPKKPSTEVLCEEEEHAKESPSELAERLSSMTLAEAEIEKELEVVKQSLRDLLTDLGMMDLYPNFSLPETTDNPRVVNV